MYSESTHHRRTGAHSDGAPSIALFHAMHPCIISESGVPRYLSGEILPDMRVPEKGSMIDRIEAALREAFQKSGITLPKDSNMSIHLVRDHRGNAESWRMECTGAWANATDRLLTATRDKQKSTCPDR